MIHTENLRVNWIDTDASGRIHYTAALRYFEIAEHGLMRELFGGAGTPSTRSFGLPRVHVEADYAAALTYPDQFKCTARVAAVGRTSVTYGFEARRSPDDILCLTGKIVAVAVCDDGTSMPLPAEFREVLERASQS